MANVKSDDFQMSPELWQFAFGLLTSSEVNRLRELHSQRWSSIEHNDQLWRALYARAFDTVTNHSQRTVRISDAKSVDVFNSAPRLLSGSDELAPLVDEHRRFYSDKERNLSQAPRSLWMAIFQRDWQNFMHIYTNRHNKVLRYEYPPAAKPLITLWIDFSYDAGNNKDTAESLAVSVAPRMRDSMSLSEFAVVNDLFRNGLGVELLYKPTRGEVPWMTKRQTASVLKWQGVIDQSGLRDDDSSSTAAAKDSALMPFIVADTTHQDANRDKLVLGMGNFDFTRIQRTQFELAVFLTKDREPLMERGLLINSRQFYSNAQIDALIRPPSNAARHIVEPPNEESNQLVDAMFSADEERREQALLFEQQEQAQQQQRRVRAYFEKS